MNKRREDRVAKYRATLTLPLFMASNGPVPRRYHQTEWRCCHCQQLKGYQARGYCVNDPKQEPRGGPSRWNKQEIQTALTILGYQPQAPPEVSPETSISPSPSPETTMGSETTLAMGQGSSTYTGTTLVPSRETPCTTCGCRSAKCSSRLRPSITKAKAKPAYRGLGSRNRLVNNQWICHACLYSVKV
jgi:hypothetical protein